MYEKYLYWYCLLCNRKFQFCLENAIVIVETKRSILSFTGVQIHRSSYSIHQSLHWVHQTTSSFYWPRWKVFHSTSKYREVGNLNIYINVYPHYMILPYLMCKEIVNWLIFSCLKILHECLDDEKDDKPQLGQAASTKYRNRRISGDSVSSQSHTNIYNSKRTSTISDNDKLNLSIIEQVEEAVIESIRVSKISS